jgi:hypothetical protein
VSLNVPDITMHAVVGIHGLDIECVLDLKLWHDIFNFIDLIKKRGSSHTRPFLYAVDP